MRIETRLTVSEMARLIGARPKDISELLYSRTLGVDVDTVCPIVGRARMIPRRLLPKIRALLEQRGRILQEMSDDHSPFSK